jgi:hypothetical protein
MRATSTAAVTSPPFDVAYMRITGVDPSPMVVGTDPVVTLTGYGFTFADTNGGVLEPVDGGLVGLPLVWTLSGDTGATIAAGTVPGVEAIGGDLADVVLRMTVAAPSAVASSPAFDVGPDPLWLDVSFASGAPGAGQAAVTVGLQTILGSAFGANPFPFGFNVSDVASASFAWWVNLGPPGEQTENPAAGPVVVIVDQDTMDVVATLLAFSGEGIMFDVVGFGGVDSPLTASSGWHCIAVTMEWGAPNGFKLFLDGARIASRSMPGPASAAFPVVCAAAHGRNPGANSRVGACPAIWRRALSEAEVLRLWNEASFPP